MGNQAPKLTTDVLLEIDDITPPPSINGTPLKKGAETSVDLQQIFPHLQHLQRPRSSTIQVLQNRTSDETSDCTITKSEDFDFFHSSLDPRSPSTQFYRTPVKPRSNSFSSPSPLKHHKTTQHQQEVVPLVEAVSGTKSTKSVPLQPLALSKSNILTTDCTSLPTLPDVSKKNTSSENDAPLTLPSNLSFNYSKLDTVNKRMSVPYGNRGSVEDLESLQKLRQMRNSNKRNTHAIKVYNQQEKSQQASKLNCMYSVKNLR